jgi:hypothetical protein
VFSNKEEDEEIISIEQFFDFKKEAKKYSDYRKSFADKTSSIQNEWITNSNLNKNSFRNIISDTINQSVIELNKIQPIVGILTKNKNLSYVVELNKKYIENFNSINENREKLNALLQIKNESKSNNSQNKPLVFEPATPSNINEVLQEDRKLFPVLSKYSKPILILGGLSILSALGYYLDPPPPPPPPPIVNNTSTPKTEAENVEILAKAYVYSSNPKVDSIMNLINIASKKNKGEIVIALLDDMKTNIGISNYSLKSPYNIVYLNNLRNQFTQKTVQNEEEHNVNKPAPKKDKPAPKKDKPAPKKDKPAPKKDKPAPKKDKPAPKKDKPAPASNTPNDFKSKD